MISIQSYNKTNNTMMSEINRDNSILIIGKGSNEIKLNEIYKPKNSIEVESIYGESELTNAYQDAIRNGAENIFVMNCFKTTDFIDSIEYVRYYNFAFIVPVGIKLSDTFYNGEYNRDIYFAEHYLNEFSKFTNTLLIFTDEHASLYENIDHYLLDMKNKLSSFKDTCNYLLSNHGRNIAFCLNNLENKNYSNVILAAKLSSTNIGSYPDNISTKAIFDIDNQDIYEHEIIYFKNNVHVNTSIENLKNLRTNFDANKLISIDRVIKHIERTIDMSFVVGKLYNQYIKMMLHDYLDSFLRKLVGSAINNYRINDIQFVRSQNMTGYVTVNIDIYPINSLEEINVLLEAK